MNNQKVKILILSAIVLIGGVLSYTMAKNSDSSDFRQQDAKSTVNDNPPANQPVEENPNDSVAKGSYASYDAAKLADAENGAVVIYFHAPWCPTCKESDKNFMASNAPAGLTLLKTDYDSSKDLKKKYSVTYQHTFVQVDKDGNQIKKWNGSTSYEQIQKKLD